MQDTRTSAKQRSGCFAEVREGFYVMESKFLLSQGSGKPQQTRAGSYRHAEQHSAQGGQ